jgi:hypothetical protein
MKVMDGGSEMMQAEKPEAVMLDEALVLLGYGVIEGSSEGMLRITTPDGNDEGEISLADCWALFKQRHRKLFESNPPAWDESRYGAFRLTFSGFCPVCGYGIFNGRHECPGE